MKRTLKRGLSLLLMAAMLLSLFPAEVFAEDEQIGETPAEPTEIVSVEPSPDVTSEPSVEPDGEEEGLPTEEPSAEPSEGPIADPTEEPTDEPSAGPTEEPSSEDPAEEPSTEPSEEDVAPEEPQPDEGEEEGKKPSDDDISGAILKDDSWVSIDPESNEVSYSLHLTGLPKSDLVRFTIVVVNKTPDTSGVLDSDYEIWGNDDNMHPNTATNARLAMGAGNTYAPYWYIAVSITTGAGDDQYLVSKKESGQDGNYHEVKLNFVPGDSYKTVAESLANAYGDLVDSAEYELILHSDSALGTDADPTQASRRVKRDAVVSAGRPLLTGPTLVTIDATEDDDGNGNPGFIASLFGQITNIGSATAVITGINVDDSEHGIEDYWFCYAEDEEAEWGADVELGIDKFSNVMIESNLWDEDDNLLPIGYSSLTSETPYEFNVIISYTDEDGNGSYTLTIPVRVVYSTPQLLAEFDMYVYQMDKAQTVKGTAYNSGSYMSPDGGSLAGGFAFAASQYNFDGAGLAVARHPVAKANVEGRGTPIEFQVTVPANTPVTAAGSPLVGTFTFTDYPESQAKVVFNVHVLPAPRAKIDDDAITITSQEQLTEWLGATGVAAKTYFLKNSGDGVATITNVGIGSTSSGYDEIPTTSDMSALTGLINRTVAGSPSGTGFSVADYWDGDQIKEGEKYEQKVVITYKDAFTDEFGEAAKTATITFRIDIGKTEVPVTVKINKNNNAWTAASEGFAAPTLVALTSVGGAQPSSGTTVATSGAAAGSATINVTPNTNYDVWVQRGSDGWRKVSTINVAGDPYTHTVNYYSATVKIAGGGSNGYGIDWTGTTLTAVGDKASYNDGNNKVSSKLFLDISQGTTENIKYKLTLPTGVSLDGDPRLSGVNTTTDKFAKSGDTYQFIMPLKDVTITHDILLPWNVTIETVYGSPATATAVKSIELRTTGSTSAAHSASDKSSLAVTNIAADASYEVWVNGFKTDKTVSRANNGQTVQVTIYKITPSVQYVTNASTVTPTSYTPQDTAPTVNIAATASGTANAAFAYVPQGATGTIAVAKTNGTTGRYTAHDTAWTKDAGTTPAVTDNNYTVTGINADVSLKANFIPSHKITIAASKRPGGVVISSNAPTASISVNGVTLANSDTTYVPIANANGTSAAFAVTDPTTTNTAYISPGDWEAAAAFGGTAGAYTTSADATVTPIFALKPTLSPDSRSYDIGAGASSPTLPVYTWTRNDAADPGLVKIQIKKNSEADTAYADLAAANYTVSGANYTLTANYLKTLDVGTYNLKFVSTTDGTNTDLTANLVISSTPANLTAVNIKNNTDNSTTLAASGDPLVYVSHVNANIRTQDLSWTWYRSATKPTAGTHAATPDADWTEIQAAAVGTAGGNTYTVTDADKGYYVFALVTASVTGQGTAVSNPIGVKYEINVKTVNSAGTSIGAATGSPTAVYYTVDGGPTKTTVAYNATAGAFVATGLEPGKTYNFYTNAVGGKTGTSDPFVKAADKTHTNRTDVTTTYYTVSTGDITADNGKYSSVGFTSSGSYYAHGSVTGVGITAAVGSTAVTEGGYVLSGQSAVFTAADWSKDYTLTFSQKMGANAKATLAKATGNATNLKRVSTGLTINGDTTVDGVLAMNFYDVAAYVMGTGAVTEITLTLTDDSKTYVFTTAATDADNSKYNGVGGTAVTTQMTNSSNSPQTFSLPKGTYAAGSTVTPATTRDGYRTPHATGTTPAYSASLNLSVTANTSFDIGTTATKLLLNVSDSYSGSFSPTAAVTGSAEYTAGTVTDGTMTRTVTVPYQYAAQTISLTLTNSNTSTGSMSGVTIGAITGNGTGKPVVSVGTAVSGVTLAKNANRTSSLVIAASNDVVPGTYTYTVEMSFTESGNTPKVTYTLNVVVEEGKLISSTIKQNSETSTVANGKAAKVGDTLNFDNFVAQKLTNYNGTYGAATYANGKDDFDTADYTYQWQTSANGAAATPTWTDISGANDATYTIQTGDAGKDIRLLVKSVANGKLIETAPSAYVSVGYNATVTVNEDGSAITAEGDYAVTLRPKTGTSGDVALTFDSANKVFTTNGSAALVRGVEYSIVVKNGTYASAKDTTLTTSISSTSTTATVNYYTVKYMSSIAAAQRYEYKTGSGETFASDPAISAVVVGDSNKAIATGKSVLSGESVRFGTTWTQDYSIAWKMTGSSNAIADGDSTLTSTLSGTKNENLTRSYTAAANTVYATLTQKTYTVKGKVANETGKSGGTLDSATLTDGRTSLVYATKGTGITSGNSISGTGAPNADITFVLPKGTYTIGGAPGSATSLDGYAASGTATVHQTEPVNLTVSADATNAFKIFVEGEKINLVVTDTDAPTGDLKAETTRFYAYAPVTPITVKLENDGNNDMTVTKIEVFKGSGTTAITDFTSEPVTFTIPDLGENGTVLKTGKANNVQYTISPKAGQTNDKDTTYKIKVTATTAVGTTVTNNTEFTYTFKVNPVTVATASISGSAISGQTLTADYTITQFNHATGANETAQRAAVKTALEDSTASKTGRDIGYAWFRANSALTNPTFTAGTTPSLTGATFITGATNPTYTVAAADDGKVLYLVVYGKSTGDTDTANANGSAITRIDAHYTGEITVNLDNTKVTSATDAARYIVQLREGTNTISTTFNAGVYKTDSQLDPTKTYTVWATRSTTANDKTSGSEVWVDTTEKISNTGRSATVNYYTTAYEPNAAVNDNGSSIKTDTTLTGPIDNAVSAIIKGTTVALTPTDAVLRGTTVTFKYDKTKDDKTTGTARHWSDTGIQAYYKMTWGGSAATPAAAYSAVVDKDVTPTTDPITKVTAELSQEVYTITFRVSGGGTVSNPTLTVETGKGSGSRVATGTFNTTTNSTVTFSNMPAGDYTLTSTAGSETVIVSYVYGPGTTKTTTQIKGTANTSAPVPVTQSSTANNVINLEASTYVVNWYEKGTAADWSDKKADTAEVLGTFTYGYASTVADGAEIERRLYNTGNTAIPALKIAASNTNSVVAYTDSAGNNVTTAVTTGAGVSLPVGDYIVAKIKPATGKDYATTAYSSTLTASSSKTLTGNRVFTPSYTVNVATIDAYDLSTIAAPATGVALDTVTGKTQQAKLASEAAVQTEPAGGRLIATGTTMTWAPTTTPAAAGTVYTVTVVANAISNNYVFSTDKSGYTLNGAAPTSSALSNNNRTLTLTYTFPATAPTVVSVTATANGGYTAKGTITANATSTVAQEMFWVVTEKGGTAPTSAAAIVAAAAADGWVDFGHGDAVYRNNRWELANFDIDGLEPGTEYTIYATSRNKANTDAVGNMANADFKTWYRVDVVTNPTTGAGSITAPATVTGSSHTNDNGKHVVYVTPGSSTSLSASLNAGVTYVFGSWTRVAKAGDAGAVAIGTSMTNQSFTPTENTTVYANFTAKAKLKVTGPAIPTSVTVGAAAPNVVAATANVANIGTGSTTGNVKALVAAAGTTWNPASLPTAVTTFSVTKYTEKKLAATDSEVFGVEPTSTTTAGTQRARVFFYDAGEPAIYDYIDVEFTVVEAGAATFTPPSHQHDLYLEGKSGQPKPHDDDWVVTFTHVGAISGKNDFTTLKSIQVTAKPAGDTTTDLNTEMDSSLYTFTVGTGTTHTLALEKFVRSVAATAKAGDSYTIAVVLADQENNTSPATLTLTFIDTTPHITAASITQTSLTTGAAATATATLDRTTYNPTTSNNVHYQWYRTDSSTKPADTNWTKGGTNPHDAQAVWTWDGATAIAGANTASYTATATDAGHYLYVVATGDDNGDYARNGAVSTPVYVSPTVAVVIDGMGNDYGTASVGAKSTTKVGNANKQTQTVGAGGNVTINAVANSGYYFTGWTFDNYAAGVAATASQSIAPTGNGDVTAHANFDKLPTLTKDETFDTSAPADLTFTYTKNDGSGHVEIVINGVTVGTGKISGSSFTVDSGTPALPTGVTFNGTSLKLTKEWIAANLPSSGSSATTHQYDVKINDLDKGAAATGGYAGYDKGVKITVVTNSYTVTSYTDKQTDGKWSGKYLGTVKTGSSAASVLDSGNGNSVASVQSGNTVTLVATPRAGYRFKQWTVMEGDDPATTANAKGYFGTSTNKQLTSTSATATFTPTANVAVRAEFEPIDFTITTTAGYVEYAATSMARRPAISASAASGTQTFAYAVATQAEVTAAGETWDTRDDAALPSWLALSAAGAVTFTAPATGVNVEKKDDDSDYEDELSVWVKVTSNETGLIHYKKLVVNVQPSQLSFDVAPTYPTVFVGDSVSTTGIATVNAINNITPVSVSTRANSWKQIKWTIEGATGTEPVDTAIDAPNNYNYIVTASWDPDDADQQYNYLPVSAEIQVTAMPTSHLFGFVKEEGSVTPIHSDVDTAIYLTDVGEYTYFLKNIKDKLYKTTVTASSAAFNVSLANADGTAGTPATSFNIGDMETSATQQFVFTPKSGVNFTVGEYKVTLTATGYPRADSGAADKMTQVFEFTYKVNPKPISIVDIEKLDLSGLTVGDSITALWTQNAPRFTDVDSANEYSYKVRVNGDKDQTLTDSLVGIRTRNNGVADKYNQTPYTMEYRWTGVGSTAAAGDSATLEVTLVANENYVFTAEPGETTTHYEFDYNDGADKTATGTVSNQNSTLKFTVGPIQPLLKNIDVRVTAPTAGATPAVPDYANATHVGYEFDADAVGGNTFYEWFKVGADGDTPMTASDEFEQGETYKVVIHVDRNETAGKWVPNDQIITTGNGSRLQTTGTNNAVHNAMDTTITLQWTLQKVTPPPVAPSTTYYEVNYIIVPGGNTPDPTTELVAAGGYPEHVPHVTPNNNDEYQFIGWVRDDPTGKTIKEIVPNLLVKPEMVKINQDTDFYAVYGLREIKVTYDLGSFGKTTDPTQEIVARYAYPSFTPDVTIVDQYKNLARFVGWSIEKPDHALVVNLVDPLTTQIINDTVFYAVYEIDEYNYHEHYMIGYPNGEFRPEGKITRAEVATIIARAVMPDFIEFNDYGDGGYSDVAGHWAQSGIAFCSNTGVFVGYEDGTFRPNQPITREEYALVIARIQGLINCEDRFEMPFKDVDKVSGWALDGVYTCYDEGWIDGYEDANELGTYTFAPQRDIGRAEAAKIMNGYLNRGVNEAGVSSLNEYIQFPDVPKWYWGYWEVAEAVNDHYYYYYLENEDGKDVPPEEWIVEAGYLNVKLDENDPDNTKNVRRSDPVYVNAN